MKERVALLLDAGFLQKKLKKIHDRFPTVEDVTVLCTSILRHERLEGCRLFRIFYYDCPPFEGSSTHPMSGETRDFSKTPVASRNRALIDSLELEPDFAVRRGELIHTGWKLGRVALRRLRSRSKTDLNPADLVPAISQKGVDMRIGLDIATLAFKRSADILVLVTGDSDIVPAMKLARKEGLKVYLQHLGHPVMRQLKAHADFVF